MQHCDWVISKNEHEIHARKFYDYVLEINLFRFCFGLGVRYG